jgi:PAT family beta-lactamase induction signal transducer AmpG
VVDAWRIEVADNGNELGLLSSAYQLGYRAALLVTDALILISASFRWQISYSVIPHSGWVLHGRHRTKTQCGGERTRRRFDVAGFSTRSAVHRVLPHHRWLGLLMLAVISLYQINFVSGPMTKHVLS